jgi:exodeoxyribonuclease V beta subunit
VIWWAGSWDSRNSPLGRLLFARDADGAVASEGATTPTDDDAVACFEALAERAPGQIAVERSRLGMPAAWAGPPPPASALEAAVFGRTLDWQWRRTSYSAITAGAHDPAPARVASEPEEPVVDDEPLSDGAAGSGPVGGRPAGDLAAPSLLGEMPGGVHVGTLVHRVLEATDFAAADLDRELAAQLAIAQARGRVELGDRATVVAGLRAALETPLGRVLDDRRLCDVDRADRLDELDFELPLAGGDTPTGRLTLAAIGDVLRAHLADDDPLAGYADRLGDAALQQDVRGYLTGSLDLVVRLPGPRFAIVDYKTNRLAAPGEELTAWHYRPDAVVAEMHRSHYALQALLYTAALHRYLRWRLPGYRAEEHVAGVAYLFVRGMSGPATPVVDGWTCGVFAWQPPHGLVAALSDALDAGREPVA